MGSAVDEAGITRHLERYRDAGLGGVHIVPVYGVRGAESKYVDFLSPRWLDLLKHTISEGNRLGLGIDMTCGTGWPFGGPWVHPPLAAARYILEEINADNAKRLDRPLQPNRNDDAGASLVVAMAYGPAGEVIELTDKVDLSSHLKWIPPASNWKVAALFQTTTNLPVERAAPGGEGLTLDYFSRRALDDYLKKFNDAFDYLGQLHVRALYNDSYENWGQNWTPRLFDEFRTRRGYDLRAHLPQLSQADTSADAVRVRSDFRETMADLIRDEFTAPWVNWAHGRKAIVRNEGHGAPGNPLDLYALADVPETEVFGTSWLEPLGLKPLPGVPERVGGAPEVQVCKFASSAAHFAGRPLCSSETCTWLGDHFKIPLEHMKAQVDLMFVMGINHIFFHGAAYSPDDAAWPGWLWYAATNVGNYMPAWNHMPALCDYIARCQSCLQAGHPDNDILVYLPIYDVWASDEGSRDNLQYTSVHFTPVWLEKLMPGFAAVGRTLWSRGYSFDFISDRQLADLSVDDGKLVAPGGIYKVLVVPKAQLVPEATMHQLVRLTQAGATIVIHKGLPGDVPGLGRLEERRAQFRAASQQIVAARWDSADRRGSGGGRVLVGDDLEKMLQAAGVERESLIDTGLKFIRRRDDCGWTYFVVNHSGQNIDAWVPLSISANSIALLDPAIAATGIAEHRSVDGHSAVYLQLQPRQSIIIRALQRSASANAERWKYTRPKSESQLAGPWHVEFFDGGTKLPEAETVESLGDWTTWSHDTTALKNFSGRARYATDFELPADSAEGLVIDLGEVCHSAKVRLNGKEIGTVISSPFRVDATSAARPGKNHLEVEVANLPANRVADLDRRGVDWKKFLFVDIRYHPFDASRWDPIRSGLIGPVKLISERQLKRDDLSSAN